MMSIRQMQHFSTTLVVGASLLLVFGASGCSRTFWREQADRDSYLAITEKLNDPRWELPRIDITPNPESRFFDPYNPDREPLPPDDGAASVYMKWVDGWQGYKGWHKFGQVMTVENPQWLANFGWSTDNVDPLTGELMGPLPELKDVTLPQAVELAQINNREYQFEIENMYLAALAVTFQRFQFGVRYLGTNGREPTADITGNFVPHGPGDNVIAGVAGGVSQLLPAGTQWAVELANNTLWLFSGGSQTQSMSNLSFSLIQPLLFGAGRQVGLEGLTQAERNLLYQARTLARLRQEIFTDVVGGPFGYLQLLFQLQQIRNSEGNIARLEEQVERLMSQASRNTRFASADLERWPADTPLPEDLPPPLSQKLAYFPEIQSLRWRSPDAEITPEEIQMLRNLSDDPEFQEAVNNMINTLQTKVATLDVLNLQSNLATSINQLRSQERALQDNLDNFKILLGLRTDMVFSINDSLLDPFELIDPRLSDLETRIDKTFVQRIGEIDPAGQDISLLRQLYTELLQLVDNVRDHGLEPVEEDMQKTLKILPERLQSLSDADAQTLQADMDRAVALLNGAKSELIRLRQDVVDTARELRDENLPPEQLTHLSEQLKYFQENLLQLVRNLTVIQVSVRVEQIEIQPFELAMQTAVEIGLNNRVDLMNERAFVMDARRKVEIAANALLSGLDVVVAGDINTPSGNRPFDFRGSESQLRAGISFTAPLDQIDERNAYRIAQINYQRARRDYMLAEDRVKQEIRDDWRQLFVLRQNLETSRRAVRIAALQYDAAVNQSTKPVEAGAVQSSGNGLAGTNLLNALNAILSAQNNLILAYTNYERNRLNIYRDMGIMEIGEDGMWNDPFYRSILNDTNDESLGPSLDGGPHPTPPAGAGGSGVGRAPSQTRLVAVPDVGNVIRADAQEPDSRNGKIRTVSGELEPAGVSRLPKELHADQSR